MPNNVNLLSVFLSVLTIIGCIVGSYLTIKVDDALARNSLRILEKRIEVAESCIVKDRDSAERDNDQTRKSVNILTVEISKLRESQTSMEKAFTSVGEALKDLSLSITDIKVFFGRLDERVRAVEGR